MAWVVAINESDPIVKSLRELKAMVGDPNPDLDMMRDIAMDVHDYLMQWLDEDYEGRDFDSDTKAEQEQLYGLLEYAYDLAASGQIDTAAEEAFNTFMQVVDSVLPELTPQIWANETPEPTRRERPREQVQDIRNKWNVGDRDNRGRLKWTRVAGVEGGERYEPGNGYYIADFYPATIIVNTRDNQAVGFQTNLNVDSQHADTFRTWMSEHGITGEDRYQYTYIRGLYNPDTKQLAMMNEDEFSKNIDDFVRLAVESGLEVNEVGVAKEMSYEERRDFEEQNPYSYVSYKFKPKSLPGVQTRISPWQLPGERARLTKWKRSASPFLA